MSYLFVTRYVYTFYHQAQQFLSDNSLNTLFPLGLRGQQLCLDSVSVQHTHACVN